MVEENKTGGQGLTAIDTILDILNKKGRTDIDSVAAACGISPAAADRLAKVLEKGKLLKIKYEFGTMYLEPAGASMVVDLTQQAKTVIDTKTSLVEEDISALETSIKRYSEGMPSITKSVKDLENLYRSKMSSISNIIKDLNKATASSESYAKSIAETEKQIETMREKASEKLSEVGVDSSKMEKESGSSLNERIEVMNKLKDQLSRTELAINTIIKNKNLTVDSIRKNVEAQLKELSININKENESIDKRLQHTMDETRVIKEEIEEQLKVSSRSLSKLGDITNDMRKTKAETEKIFGRLDQQYNAALIEIKKDKQIIDGKSAEVKQKADEIRSLLGDAGKTSEEIAEIGKEVEDLRSQIEDVRKEIGMIRQELTSTSYLKQKEKREEALDSLSTKTKQTREKVSKIYKDIRDMPKKPPLSKSGKNNKSK